MVTDIAVLEVGRSTSLKDDGQAGLPLPFTYFERRTLPIGCARSAAAASTGAAAGRAPHEAASMARSHRIAPSSSYSLQSGFDRRRSPRCERMQLLCGHAEIYETAQPNNQAIGPEALPISSSRPGL